MKESRLVKTARNIFWQFLVLMLTAVANMVLPRYIILAYGSEVNGLSSSITHVCTVDFAFGAG